MRRLVWVAVGAIGGIYAYRRGSALLADARDRGVVLSAQQAATSAMATVASARELATRVHAARLEHQSAAPTSGHAAARVMAKQEGR
jgi:hypothetical protein